MTTKINLHFGAPNDKSLGDDFKAVAVDFDPHANDEPFEGFVVGASRGGYRWEMKVMTIGSWPEVKTETCYEKVKIPFDGWTKVPYPCAYTRSCDKSWYLTIAYSGSVSLPSNIETMVRECAHLSMATALPLLATGNPGAAAAVFFEAFKSCMIAKGVQEVAQFSVGFDSRKTCGGWHKV